MLTVMSAINCQSDVLRRFNYGVRGCTFSFHFFAVITSCQPEKKTEASGYSDAFKPVFDKVNLLFATNEVERGLYYLDSAMSSISKPNVDDKFRAFAFHYVYWHKTKGDNQRALLYADSMLIAGK